MKRMVELEPKTMDELIFVAIMALVTFVVLFIGWQLIRSPFFLDM